MKDVVDIYLNDERAEPYRKMDLEANEGIMPQATVLNENICFCLIKVSQHALSLADERSLAPTHTYQLWPVRACCLRPMRTLSLAHEHLLSSDKTTPGLHALLCGTAGTGKRPRCKRRCNQFTSS